MTTPGRLITFAVALCAATASLAEDTLKPVNEVAVEMPRYEIKSDRILPAPENWLFVVVPALELTRGSKVVVAPGYEILSNYSEKNTRLFVEELQRRQLAGTILWPMLVQALPRRAIVVVFDRNSQPPTTTRIAETVGAQWEGDPIMPVERLRDGYSSVDRDWQEIQAQGGYTVRAPAQQMAQEAFLTNPELPEPATGSTAMAPTPARKPSRSFTLIPPGVVRLFAREGIVCAYVYGDEIRAGREIFTEEKLASGVSQESTRYALSAGRNKVPVWLQTGVTWLVASTEITPTRITFADAIAGLEAEHIPSLLGVLTRDTSLSSEEEQLACAFTHYGLYGDNSKHAPKFIALAERLQKEPFSEELFAQAFGASVAQVEKDLTSYLHSFANFKSMQMNGKIPDMPGFVCRVASQSEVARLKADSLITQGEPDGALDELRIAYLRGEREPTMLAVLATLEDSYGSKERARKLAAALEALPTPPARVFPLLARLKYRDLTGTRTNKEKLTSSEAKTVLSPLGRAVQNGITNEEVCTLFAETVLRTEGKPHSSVATFLAQAAKRFPDNKKIRDAAEFAGTSAPQPAAQGS